MEKALRDSLKVVKNGLRDGSKIKKTINKGVRQANKFFNSKVASGGSGTNGKEEETPPSQEQDDEKSPHGTPRKVDDCHDPIETSLSDKVEHSGVPKENDEKDNAQDQEEEEEEIDEKENEGTVSGDQEASSSGSGEDCHGCVGRDDGRPDNSKESADTRTPEDLLGYFRKWLKNLEQSLSVPTFDHHLWKTTLRAHKTAKQEQREAEEALEKAKKANASPEEMNPLEETNQAAKQNVDQALEHCQAVAGSLLQSQEFQSFLRPIDDDDDWVTWSVLASTKPKQWAQWCEQDSRRMADDILGMLHDTNFLREILQEGGPQGGNYRNFLEIYREIGPKENHVLQRLAMAVALEFANKDHCIFKSGTPIDPLQRYVHYEQAYLLGELDPDFSTFGIWNLRMTVNSDATDEQLSWGRQSLINYRPDIILSQGPKWRYCFIVKSDVAYKAPDWYMNPHSYDQILSGGGKCGPRAWYGRFICKGELTTIDCLVPPMIDFNHIF